MKPTTYRNANEPGATHAAPTTPPLKNWVLESIRAEWLAQGQMSKYREQALQKMASARQFGTKFGRISSLPPLDTSNPRRESFIGQARPANGATTADQA